MSEGDKDTPSPRTSIQAAFEAEKRKSNPTQETMLNTAFMLRLKEGDPVNLGPITLRVINNMGVGEIIDLRGFARANKTTLPGRKTFLRVAAFPANHKPLSIYVEPVELGKETLESQKSKIVDLLSLPFTPYVAGRIVQEYTIPDEARGE